MKMIKIAVMLMLCSTAQAYTKQEWEASLKKRSGYEQVKVKKDTRVCSGMVGRAKSLVGVREGSSKANDIAKYVGLRSSREAWCAAFVSYVSGGTIKTAAVADLAKLPSTSPQVGAVAIFKWSHTGIVTGVTDKGFYSVEGNSKDMVRENFHSWTQLKKCVALN